MYMGRHLCTLTAQFDIARRYGRVMATIEFEGVTFSRSGTEVLTGIDLTVADGELAAVIGPSGSGKSSLLRLVSGLDRPDSGEIRIGGESVDASQPWRNRVAMVFQDDALYEHMTVGSNLEFPWRVQGHDNATSTREATSSARRVGVRRLWDRLPGTLSGGQRGQVATARALSRSNPSVVLLDEPLARADAMVRRRFRSEIHRLHSETGLTMILATNDQHEAMALASKLIVLIDGAIRQVGAPQEVYRLPRDTTVAAFVGSPAMNLIPARLVPGEEGASVLEVGHDRVRTTRPPAADTPDRVVIGLYPGEMRQADPATSFDRTLHVTVGRVEHLGATTSIFFGIGPNPGMVFSITRPGGRPAEPGERLELTWNEEALRLYDAESGQLLESS